MTSRLVVNFTEGEREDIDIECESISVITVNDSYIEVKYSYNDGDRYQDKLLYCHAFYSIQNIVGFEIESDKEIKS